jgi:phosphoglucosamine mutase
MTDYATTGDGLIAGLQFVAAMARSGEKASRLAKSFETVPQLLKNVRYGQGSHPLEAEAVKRVIAAAEGRLQGNGRLLIRKSGTEPLVRVMAESEDSVLLAEVVDEIVAAVKIAAG